MLEKPFSSKLCIVSSVLDIVGLALRQPRSDFLSECMFHIDLKCLEKFNNFFSGC